MCADIAPDIALHSVVFHERIGTGATSTVFRVTGKKKDGTLFEAAAKRVIGHETSMFNQEVKLLMSLHHDNIITCYGALYSYDIHPMILLEYAPNGSLFDFLKSKTYLPKAQIWFWTKQIANAIKYLHDRDIAHRDIKSGNFLITKQYMLKLCDFGLSEITEITRNTSDSGTTAWMAPEIYMKRIASKASDIYSFGIVIWELWTCKIPFVGQTAAQIMWNVSDGKRPPIPARVPGNVADFLGRCWNIDRHNRPTTDEILSFATTEPSAIEF